MSWQKKIVFSPVEYINKVSGADFSGNCSVSTLKNRENCGLEYHNCIFVDKSFDNIFCAEEET